MNECRGLAAGLLALAWVGLLACDVPATSGVESAAPLDAQGHRGAAGLLPENTMPAFRRALELGVSTLELDVGVSRDGAVVVSHDPAISPDVCRHPDGTPIEGERGPLLRDLPLVELRRFDCGSSNRKPKRLPAPPWEARPGEPMPTLDEVLALAGEDPGVRFNIETKLRPGDELTHPAPVFVDAVLEVVRRHGLESRVSIQSFDWRALSRTKRRAPRVETVALLAPDTLDPAWLDGLEPEPGDPLALFAKARGFVDTISPHWRMLLAEDGPALPLAALQAEGFRVVAWTVNDEEILRRLVRMGVDGLISDYPDRLLAVLREESVPVR